MKKITKSTGQDTTPKSSHEKRLVKRSSKAEPGPGDSQENERTEYHEEPSRKAVGTSYDFQSEKNLED